MPTLPALLTNPFLHPVQRSYVGAVAIAGHTASILTAQKTDPGIGPLNSLFSPINEALAGAFTEWLSAEGIQKGKTASLADLLDSLSSTHIDDWDFAIQQVHRRGTPRYVELLPDGRSPFQRGRQAQRIAAVAALADRIGPEAALATLKADVLTFHDELMTAEDVQEGAKGATEGSSSAMQAAVTAAAVGLFQVYGGLVQLFAEEPERIGDYFNMELILAREQRSFTGSVGMGAVKNIAKRSLEPTALIRFINSGDTPLGFYLAEGKNDAMPTSGGLWLASGHDETVAVSTLGSGPYLQVYNQSTEGAGEYQLVLL